MPPPAALSTLTSRGQRLPAPHSQHSPAEPHLGSRSILLLVLSYLAFTLYLAHSLNVWIDEAYTLSTTSLPVLETAERAITFENQPPLYFVLLSLWRLLGTSPLFVRIPSILCTLAFLLLLSRVACSARAPAFFVVLYSATLPLVIWAAVETRVYALALLLAMLVLVSFDRFVFLPSTGPRDSLLHGVSVSLGLYTYSFLGFLVPGNFLFLLGSPERWKTAKRYAVVLAVAGATALPAVYWSLIATGQVGTALPDIDRTLSFFGATRLVLYQWEEHLVPVYRLLYLSEIHFSEAGVSALYWSTRVTLAGLVLLSVGDGSRWRRLLQDARVRWISLTLVCLSLQLISVLVLVNAVAASVLGDPAARARHTCLLLVPSLLMVVLVGRHVGRPRLFSAVLAALAALNCLVLAAEYREPAKRGDSKRVAEFLQAEEGRGEPILVFPSEEVLPLRVHYGGVNATLPIPEEPSLVRYEPPAFRLRDGAQVAAVLRSQGEDVPRVWLVYNRSYKNWGGLFDIGAEHLEDYLWRHFTVDLVQEFRHGVVVMRLVRRLDESAEGGRGSVDRESR